MRPTARSFILDLLSTLRSGSMPVAALVEAGGLFGIAENSVRVALTRMRSSGQVERDARGRYRLGAAAGPVSSWVTSWRDLGGRTRPWQGDWVAVLDRDRGDGSGRPERRRRDRALRFLGFRALSPGLSVRPDNLRGGVDAQRGELGRLGLPPGDLVFALRELDPVTKALACGLWDGEALCASHQALGIEVERAVERIAEPPVERAMRQSFLLGGRVIRQLLLDPLLPDTIVPGGPRRALLESMRRYDRLGRSVWAGFLGRFDVPHRSAPLDTRLAVGAERLGPPGYIEGVREGDRA